MLKIFKVMILLKFSFFVDVINAGILFLILQYFKSTMSEKRYKICLSAIPTIIIHGTIHYYQYFNEGSLIVLSESNIYQYYILLFIFVFLFQTNFQVGIGNFYTIFLATMTIMTFDYFFIPQIYILSYVNSWITISKLVCERLKNEKRSNLFQYMVIATLCLPILEATNCENFLMNYGGHALFDTFVVLIHYLEIYESIGTAENLVNAEVNKNGVVNDSYESGKRSTVSSKIKQN